MGKRRNSGKPWNDRATREDGPENVEGGHPPHLKGKAIGMYYRDKSRGAHPPHLKGKEIGLFYRDRSRKKRQMFKALGTIKLTEVKIRQIQSMLHSNSIATASLPSNSSGYSHIEDSIFKRSFLSTITGSIIDKLQTAKCEITRDDVMDEHFYTELQSKENNPKYITMLENRRRLPSYKERENLTQMIEANQVVVISGETGCGKTTQVAQFILDDYIAKKKGSMCHIVCTQPRRISAISVAERVADERGEGLGKSVGYHIRLEKIMPREKGSICYCTTGVVLRWMESDPGLTNISHLILDEIHERSVYSDFLITLLRDVIKKRTDLKVILMSATLNSQAFSKYYNNCPHINIPGFTFPVKEYFLEDVIEEIHYSFQPAHRKPWQRNQNNHEFKDYILPFIRVLRNERKYSEFVCEQLRKPESEELNLDLIFELICHICSQDPTNSSILVFLPGYMNISDLVKIIGQSQKFPSDGYKVIPLHSMMPTTEQKQIFKPAPPGIRKIIISTNIAETSITIDDVTFVIDCGKIKEKDFNVERNQETLEVQWVSRANADQRKGRAGRVKPGVCYHLYTSARHMMLDKFQKPEVIRTRLDGTILTAKILQLGKVKRFFENLMDPPDPEAVRMSLNLLERLNALDDNENLTPLGYHLGRLPIAPQMGKMILFGAIFSCLDPVLSIAAALDYKDPFQVPLGKERDADRKRINMADGTLSDHLLLHRALSLFEDSPNKGKFCYDNYLSFNTLKLLLDMKNQFMSHLHDLEFVHSFDTKNRENNWNSNNISLIKAIICAGLYPNVAIIETNEKGRVKHLTSIDQTQKYKFHPKSVLSNVTSFESNLLVYYIKIKSTSDFIHDATVLNPLPVIFFGDHFEQTMIGHTDLISISNLLKFKAEFNTSRTIKELRDRLNWLLEKKVTHPGTLDWSRNSDEINILRAIMELITTEDTGLEDVDSDDMSD